MRKIRAKSLGKREIFEGLRPLFFQKAHHNFQSLQSARSSCVLQAFPTYRCQALPLAFRSVKPADVQKRTIGERIF